jgi:hypothetical protein
MLNPMKRAHILSQNIMPSIGQVPPAMPSPITPPAGGSPVHDATAQARRKLFFPLSAEPSPLQKAHLLDITV